MGQIERQSYSYKQGLVLGLTMAEIMLLLVFCLLIAAGAVLKRQNDELAKVRLEMGAMQGTSSMNKAIANLVRSEFRQLGEIGPDGEVPQSKIDDFWKEIVESREVVRNLETNGLSKAEAKENAKFLSAVMEARKAGATVDDIKGMSAKAAELSAKTKELEEARGMIEKLTKQVNAAAGRDAEGHKWPPMISLSEAGGYFFKLGSAELSPDFERRLREVVVPTLVKTAREYDVDVIEVVGHTDELPIGGKSSNLDRDMVEVLKGNKPIMALRPGDNAGLGIARSVSVVRNLLQDERLNGLRVLPLSGAQLIKTNETLANGQDVQGDVQERRRIEIRLRKSGEAATPTGGASAAPAQ